MEKKQPVNKVQMGNINVTLWVNKGKSENGKEFDMKSVKIQKSYKDNDDKWQNVDININITDVPKVVSALNDIYFKALTNDKE